MDTVERKREIKSVCHASIPGSICKAYTSLRISPPCGAVATARPVSIAYNKAMLNIAIYFLTGGVVTTAIVLLEESGLRLLSGLATLMPVFTLIAYFFIGESRGGMNLSDHAKLVLIGTLVTWVPYMLVVIWLAPHVNTYKAVGAGLAVFFVLAIMFLLLTQHFGWFQ